MQLVDEWFELLHYCNGEVDDAVFRFKHDVLAHKFQRLSLEEQGEFCAGIAKRRKT